MAGLPQLPPLDRAEAERCALALLRDKGVRRRTTMAISENGGPSVPVPYIVFQSAQEERYLPPRTPESRYRGDDGSWRLWAAFRCLAQAREYAADRKLCLRWLSRHAAAPATRRGRPPKQVSAWAVSTKRRAVGRPGMRRKRREYRDREAARADRILPRAADERRAADEALILDSGENLRPGRTLRRMQSLAVRISQFRASEGDEAHLARAVWGFWYQQTLTEWREPVGGSIPGPAGFPCGEKRDVALRMGFCLDHFEDRCPAWRFVGRARILAWALQNSFDDIPAYNCGGEIISVSVENRHLLHGADLALSPQVAEQHGIRVHPLDDGRLMAWFREHAKSAYI